jgi:hypothetical protein
MKIARKELGKLCDCFKKNQRLALEKKVRREVVVVVDQKIKKIFSKGILVLKMSGLNTPFLRID